MDFNRVPANVEEVLKVITRSETGRKLLERFMPEHSRGRVRLAPYGPELIARMREALGEGQPIGAAFVIDGDQGTIYFDPTSPLGVLAPFLVHEMVHSLNRDLWAARRRVMTREDRDRLMLEVETEAFAAQHLFTTELRARFPEYSEFLKACFPRAKVLVERLTSTDIAELYGFKVG